MKCSYCQKEIEHGRLWGCDGDFVCDDDCHAGMRREMDIVCGMSDHEFESWMLGGPLQKETK